MSYEKILLPIGEAIVVKRSGNKFSFISSNVYRIKGVLENTGVGEILDNGLKIKINFGSSFYNEFNK